MRRWMASRSISARHRRGADVHTSGSSGRARGAPSAIGGQSRESVTRNQKHGPETLLKLFVCVRRCAQPRLQDADDLTLGSTIYEHHKTESKALFVGQIQSGQLVVD